MSSTQNEETPPSVEQQRDNIDSFTKDVTEKVLKDMPCCEEHDAEMRMALAAVGEMLKQNIGKVTPLVASKALLHYGRHLGVTLIKDQIPDIINKLVGGRNVEEAVADSISISSGKPTMH